MTKCIEVSGRTEVRNELTSSSQQVTRIKKEETESGDWTRQTQDKSPSQKRHQDPTDFVEDRRRKVQIQITFSLSEKGV